MGWILLFLLGQLLVIAILGTLSEREYRRLTGRTDFWRFE